MVPEFEIKAMYEAYRGGMSLVAVGKATGRSYKCVEELFRRRNLPMRPPKGGPKHKPDGSFAPLVPTPPEQLCALIESAKKFKLPDPIRTEWRHWPMWKRAWFIHALRHKFASPADRPVGPFSAGIIPFDYTTPEAWDILIRMNAGLDSWHWRCKINLNTQGVIYRDTLWFWSAHTRGYQKCGQWTPERKRPGLHRFIWEEANGRALPPQSVVRFADGNQNNFAPSNLTLATKNDVARENQAASLARKSRQTTALLLNLTQTHHDTASLLSAVKSRQHSRP